MSRIYRTYTGYNLRAPSALSERLRRFSAHVTSSAALTSLTRSAWPFRPSIPPLVYLPARASPPAHSNTLSFHTWLVVAAFLQRRQPSSPRITARRSRATHSSVPNRHPTKSTHLARCVPSQGSICCPPAQRRGLGGARPVTHWWGRFADLSGQGNEDCATLSRSHAAPLSHIRRDPPQGRPPATTSPPVRGHVSGRLLRRQTHQATPPCCPRRSRQLGFPTAANAL